MLTATSRYRTGVTAALAFVLTAVLAVGCVAPSREGASTGELRSSMSSEPSSLSLIGKTDANSETLAYLITDSLVRYDDRLDLQPRLAREWEVSADGRTVTFRLREDALWQDGAPVTARDVVFTVDKVRDPATEARSYASQFEDLAAIEALDAHTVRATYTRPYADVLDSWTLPIIPEHLAGKDADLLTGAFARHPVGCGPFRLVGERRGSEIALDANPTYWDGRPAIDRLVFRILPDERTAFESLLRGDLDVMTVTPDLWREAQSSTRAARLARFVYYRLGVWYIGWNQDGSNPFFIDPRVRRAMVHSLDRATFASRVLGGLARPAVGTYHPDSPWVHRGLAPWPFDPDEARRLLDQAGWRDTDGDGVRDKDGSPFSFVLILPATTQEIADRMAAWTQQSLAAIGVRMAIERVEWRAFQERRREHRFQAAMASFHFTPVPDQFELFHSSARERGLNYGGFSDPEVDRLLVEGRTVFDTEARRALYHRLQERLHELEPISCLFNFAAPVLHDARLEGIRKSPLGLWKTVPGPARWEWASRASGG